jgi:chromosome partitioning protein
MRNCVLSHFASQKGGSGKTTIAAHLAVQAGRVGQGPAVIVDTDPQASLGDGGVSAGMKTRRSPR